METKKLLIRLEPEDRIAVVALQALLFAPSATEAIRRALRTLVEQLDDTGEVRAGAAKNIEDEDR